MCGICGMMEPNAGVDDFRSRLPGMVRSLHHRGPDENGLHIENHVALGHARLSIIDLGTGQQPMCNEDRSVWVIYNGEIYNFASLREKLIASGHLFQTRCDTEVILHLYEQQGIEGVKRLRGMFAFALWDARERRLYLVRDRIGIKPLYWTLKGNRLIFGSEIKAILAHGQVERSVRPDALSDYLTFLYAPAPKTMFRNIYKLPPGYWLCFDAHGVRTHQYWDIPLPVHAQRSREEWGDRILEKLSECVSQRLISDVPLGAFLSGGVDSSAIVSLMSQAVSSSPVTTSVGFNEEEFNELQYARRIANRYRTNHHEQIVEPEASDIVETLAHAYDEPFADYSAIPTYYVCKAARSRVTVALSGDGGDENFAGYRRYRFDMLERQLRRRIPGIFRTALLGPASRMYPKADWLPRMFRAKTLLTNLADDAAAAYARSVGFLDSAAKQAFLTNDVRSALGLYRSDELIRQYMKQSKRDGLDQLLYVDFKTFLVDDILTKVDRASMAVSLEVRVPLLDHEFVELATTIPPELKLYRGDGKSVLKSALHSRVDHDVLYRKKQGFTPPLCEWFRCELRHMFTDLVLSSDSMSRDYLEPKAVETAWRLHQKRVRDFTPLLYAIMMFELWMRRFISGSSLHMDSQLPIQVVK